jgi:hypothetical protein
MIEKSIDDLIREECLPMRDCMLTVQDASGEAAFLYFKDAELIEANYAALWGKDALSQILMWQLADYNVAPLPLGIKRSLWEPLDALLNPKIQPTASGRIPVLKAKYSASSKGEDFSEFENFKKISGITKIILTNDGKIKVVYENPVEAKVATEWVIEFMQKGRAMGESLGFGFMDRWSLYTDRFSAVCLKHEKGLLTIFRKPSGGGDDFEAECLAAATASKT